MSVILRRFIYSFIILVCFVNGQLWSQKPAEKYDFVNIKDMITRIAVSTIIQDDSGFIWMCTNGAGLIRYDGIDYISYKHEFNDSTSISSNVIFCSLMDAENRIWIGTGAGLDLYDRDLNKFKRISLVAETESNPSIRSLEQDDAGNLFIGTMNHGLFKIHLESFKIEKISNLKLQGDTRLMNINAIRYTPSGRIFVGTNFGLKEIDIESNSLVNSTALTVENDPDSGVTIFSLLLDDMNNLWAGTLLNGVFKINLNEKLLNNQFKFEHFPISNKKIQVMIQLEDQTLMLGSENDGMFHLDVDGTVIKNYLFDKTDEKSIRSNSIWSLFVDNNKRIWMSYYNKGVAISDPLYSKFKSIESLTGNPNSLNIASVTGVLRDEYGDLWIALDGGGIDKYNSKTEKFTHINISDQRTYSGLTSDYIETIFIDSKGNLWAGSWDSGVYLLKKDQRKFINFNIENTKGKLTSNTILSFAEDSNGIIWIGSFYKGLHSYDPSTNTFSHYDTNEFVNNRIPNSDVRDLLIDSNDHIWLGTTRGLFKIEKISNGVYSVLSMAERMAEEFNNDESANYILSLLLDANNVLWIGTRGAGLCKYEIENDKITWYNKHNGLALENVVGMVQSLDDDLWLSGNSGITKYDKEKNEFTSYSINDGLLSNDFNFNSNSIDQHGILYFGNYYGIDYFNPKDIKMNNTIPSLHLTGFKLFNENVIPGEKGSPLEKVIAETNSITLDHTQSVFTIEYAGINYTRSEKNQYAYYLEGLENSWNYVGNARSATYTSLNHGEYNFKLKAANNDGVWNEEPLSLKIIILPPWWKTHWALFAYIGFLLLSLYLFGLLARQRIAAKQTIANERIKRIQEKELNEKKFQFFTNLSHEFRTPLTLILNPLANLMNDKTLGLPLNVRKKHQIIKKNSDRLSRLINELLDFRRLEMNKLRVKARKINLISFVGEVIAHFEEEASERNIYLSIDADISDLEIWADESMLEKIIFNILSNAFKVTSEGGAISVVISMKYDKTGLSNENEHQGFAEFAEIRISDSGPGLEREQLKRIFERFYQVDNLNKAYYGGTGIGLEVVKNFVELHSGKVEVESELGVGSVFSILLPLGKAHFEEDQIIDENKESSILVKRQESVFNGSPAIDLQEEVKEQVARTNTLLIVEDNIELRNYLKDELKEWYRVITAINGKEGLKKTKEFIPDIIITDIIMPEMNGIDFCKIIKSDIRTSHIPILVLSAKSKIDDRMEIIEMGADAHLSKPFDMRLVKLTLDQLIKSRQLIFDKYFGAISGAAENEKATSIDKEFIQKILSYINDNISDSNLSVESLASELNLSRSQLYRKVKTLTGQSVNEFLRKIRLQRAKQKLENGSSTISEVCYQVGFSSRSYFTKCFKAHFGVLPTDVQVKD